MIELGRVCVKIAGRDAGLTCVIIDVIDSNTVLIDGQTRRRKCNIVHLEPLDKMVKVAKNASSADVATALKGIGVEVVAKKSKAATTRPRKVRKVKEKKPAKKKAASKKVTKKVTKEAASEKAKPEEVKPEAGKEAVPKPADKQ